MPHQQRFAPFIAEHVVGDASSLPRGAAALDNRQVVPNGVRRGPVMPRHGDRVRDLRTPVAPAGRLARTRSGVGHERAMFVEEVGHPFGVSPIHALCVGVHQVRDRQPIGDKSEDVGVGSSKHLQS